MQLRQSGSNFRPNKPAPRLCRLDLLVEVPGGEVGDNLRERLQLSGLKTSGEPVLEDIVGDSGTTKELVPRAALASTAVC